MLRIARYITSPVTLVRCCGVCRDWRVWFSTEDLWQRMRCGEAFKCAVRFNIQAAEGANLETTPKDAYPNETAREHTLRVLANARANHRLWKAHLAAEHRAALVRVENEAIEARNAARAWDPMQVGIIACLVSLLIACVMLAARLSRAIAWPWLVVVMVPGLLFTASACFTLLARYPSFSDAYLGHLIGMAALSVVPPLMVLLKLDGIVDARWALVLIPFYLTLGALALLACQQIVKESLGDFAFLAWIAYALVIACVASFVALLVLRLDCRAPCAASPNAWLVATPLFVLIGLVSCISSILMGFAGGTDVLPATLGGGVCAALCVVLFILSSERKVSFFVPFAPIGLVLLCVLGTILNDRTQQLQAARQHAQQPRVEPPRLQRLRPWNAIINPRRAQV